jgi:hypothetical protein
MYLNGIHRSLLVITIPTLCARLNHFILFILLNLIHSHRALDLFYYEAKL